MIDSGRVDTLIGTAGDFKPLIVVGNYLYLQKMLHLEDQFVEVLRRRIDNVIPTWSPQAVEEALAMCWNEPCIATDVRLHWRSEQQSAVRAAVQYPVTLVSGGPGTGKTTVVLSILRVLRGWGKPEEIALAAPTGKAANRMGEAIRVGREGIADPAPADQDLAKSGRTTHSAPAAGILTTIGRFAHHENNRLAERVVVVDESSMIDLAMMGRLVGRSATTHGSSYWATLINFPPSRPVLYLATCWPWAMPSAARRLAFRPFN